MQGIVSGTTKVSDLVAEIEAASKEQSEGIGQVTEGLGQIDQVTQQATANAEETAAQFSARPVAPPTLSSPLQLAIESGSRSPAQVISLNDAEFVKY